jgi:MscS family membrane protein
MIEFFGNIFYQQQVQNWLLFCVILIIAVVLGKILYTFFKYVAEAMAAKTRTKFDDVVVKVLQGPLIFSIFLGFFWYSLPLLELASDAEETVRKVVVVLMILTITFFVARLADRLIEVMILDEAINLDAKTKKFLPIIQRIVRVAIFVIAALVIFDYFGLSITSLLAGLGLVGLTVALAAKDTLANLFGSFSVMTDQAFKVGDTIKIDKYEGVVEDIGFRSTKIKTGTNTKIIVPNTKLANSIIENLSQRENRRREIKLILDAATPAAKIATVRDQIKLVLSKLPVEEKTQVNLMELGLYGPELVIVYWPQQIKDSLVLRERILLAAHKIMEETGVRPAAFVAKFSK